MAESSMRVQLVSASGIAVVFTILSLHAKVSVSLTRDPEVLNKQSGFVGLSSRHRQGTRGNPEWLSTKLLASHQTGRQPSLPEPPIPYKYSDFMAWFDEQDWVSMNLPMTPTRSWFDVDAALSEGPKHHWFLDKDMTAIAAVAKRVNRFLFMREIMLSGSDDAQSSLPMHLLILWLLRDDLNNSRNNLVLDAGCGDGWLSAAFNLMQGSSGGQVLGFDIAGVEQAQLNIASPNVATGGLRPPLPKLFPGNILVDGFSVNDSVAQALPPESLDVVNVGAALRNDYPTSPTFTRLTRLLRKGAALTVPICKEEPGENGHCKADFRLYRRTLQGEVVREVAGKYDVLFLVVEPGPEPVTTAAG